MRQTDSGIELPYQYRVLHSINSKADAQ